MHSIPALPFEHWFTYRDYRAVASTSPDRRDSMSGIISFTAKGAAMASSFATLTAFLLLGAVPLAVPAADPPLPALSEPAQTQATGVYAGAAR